VHRPSEAKYYGKSWKIGYFSMKRREQKTTKINEQSIFTSQGMEVENRKGKKLGRFSIESRKQSGSITLVLVLV